MTIILPNWHTVNNKYNGVNAPIYNEHRVWGGKYIIDAYN